MTSSWKYFLRWIGEDQPATSEIFLYNFIDNKTVAKMNKNLLLVRCDCINFIDISIHYMLQACHYNHSYKFGGVPVFFEDWRFGILSVKKRITWKITGLKIEEVKMDSLKMWSSKKWRLFVKKGFLNVKIVKLRYHGTPTKFSAFCWQ